MVDANDEFSWFFRDEFPGVVKTTFLILHDREQAREIAQEAFIEVLTRWKAVSRYERPDAWVRRVAIRMAVRAVRRERLRVLREREVAPPPLQAPVDVDVIKAVRTLPPAQRAAVVLFYFEDRPVSEIASILGCSQATAKVHLHRGRKRLAERLSGEVADVP
jgi:RNA polymerase sigma-70 factor (ECF subfamily)